MSGQLILSVSREFGSGGHEIARTLAEDFGLPLYEENILNKIAEDRGVDPGRLARYDELPKNRLMSRTVKGFSNAPEDVIAQMQFQYLKERSALGESFVVLGRCAEEVLKGSPGLITIFVLADLAFKTERTMLRGPVTEKEAISLIARKDRKRRTYHNQFCKGTWGEAKNYDITINSGRLGIKGTTELLEEYIRDRMRSAESPAP
ncbi:MAG: AAA family ATPase [Lawsonibacter sp.]